MPKAKAKVKAEAKSKAKTNPSATRARAICAEIESLGAKVALGPRYSEAKIAKGEKEIGFKVPKDFREFLLELGGISIELVRPWYFYGIEPWKTEQYNDEFDPCREEAGDDDDGPYFPKRFIVLHDQEEYSNAAEGLVYDADLESLFHTDGLRYVGKDEALSVSYWPKLIELLESIRNRIADPTDPIVSGKEEEVNKLRKLPKKKKR